MVVQIVLDMRYFLIIMMVMTIAFVQLFYIVQLPIGPLDEPGEFLWAVFHAAWLGNFLEGFEASFLGRIMFVLMTLFMIVVLLNLLIAIMGNTFSIVNECLTVEFYFNLAELTHEIEMLMTPSEQHSHKNFPRYIVYTTGKQILEASASSGGASDTSSADGSAGTTEQMFEMLKVMETRLNEVRSQVSDLIESQRNNRAEDDGSRLSRQGTPTKRLLARGCARPLELLQPLIEFNELRAGVRSISGDSDGAVFFSRQGRSLSSPGRTALRTPDRVHAEHEPTSITPRIVEGKGVRFAQNGTGGSPPSRGWPPSDIEHKAEASPRTASSVCCGPSSRTAPDGTVSHI
eukprot:gnl/TRDRNA2_/TRDRNA2_167733_c1_seq1.p1 gnl/TRDRNA2_/TRDRNA2_167733_c1~~gnl/TRDRNA2_/TRDRNA2_167733_c1_seq1.p1  ORF type:complete len:346 (+),score=25.92 gnl/TRDRNA2_/TRDRNA2_167733_c1_seq1:2-1039(+)